MNGSKEIPSLLIKPKYVFTIIFFRTVFFLIFGAVFLSIVSIGVTSMAGGGDEQFGTVITAVVSAWAAVYFLVIFVIVPGRYGASSYRFYADRVEFESGTLFSLESRSIIYPRIIETGCVKQIFQIPRGMGNIVLKVAAAGTNPGPGNTLLMDNLVITDIEKADDNLEKIRGLVQKKG
jgi:membrane protein YdbS with pleckstrin-like domain